MLKKRVRKKKTDPNRIELPTPCEMVNATVYGLQRAPSTGGILAYTLLRIVIQDGIVIKVTKSEPELKHILISRAEYALGDVL